MPSGVAASAPEVSATEVSAVDASLQNFTSYLEAYSVYVAKADFKFNAAHFVAYKGFRERLHGHNYTVGVRLEAEGVQACVHLCPPAPPVTAAPAALLPPPPPLPLLLSPVVEWLHWLAQLRFAERIRPCVCVAPLLLLADLEQRWLRRGLRRDQEGGARSVQEPERAVPMPGTQRRAVDHKRGCAARRWGERGGRGAEDTVRGWRRVHVPVWRRGHAANQALHCAHVHACVRPVAACFRAHASWGGNSSPPSQHPSGRAEAVAAGALGALRQLHRLLYVHCVRAWVGRSRSLPSTSAARSSRASRSGASPSAASRRSTSRSPRRSARRPRALRAP
jgi:hypothetical protein